MPSHLMALLAVTTVVASLADDGVCVDDEETPGLQKKLQRVSREEMPKIVLEEEFDPVGEEGVLYRYSAVDTLEEIVEERMAGRYREEGDTDGGVKVIVDEILAGYVEGVDTYNGMREARLSVIGSGDLNEIPLREIGENFAELDLYDVNIASTSKAVRREPNLRKKVTIHREDVTGLLPSFRWKCEYLFGVVDKPAEAFKLLRQYIESDNFYPQHLQYDMGYNSTLRGISSSDVIIVNGVFHELGEGFTQHLNHELTRLKSTAWPGLNTRSGLGASTATLSNKLRTHLASRILKKISLNPNKVLLIVLTLDRQTRYTVGSDGTLQSPHTTRKGNSDLGVLSMFNTSEAVQVADTTSTSVSYRFADGATRYAVEETIRVTAFTYHEELDMQGWLESLRSGNTAMWSG